MKTAKAIVLGGVTAGALDLIYAFIVYGMLGLTPMTICQSIASGFLGHASYDGGMQTAVLGVVLHFAMACLMAAIFVTVARYWNYLLEKPLISGAVYGLGLFFVMNYVVVPLSAAGTGHFPAVNLLMIGTLFTHICLVGMSIALISRRVLSAA